MFSHFGATFDGTEPVKMRHPPGGHPSLAVSPLPPDPKKMRTSTKWGNS